ncbi:hypothetical protein [Bradyrhizobium sp. URHD0069]|uniref:hypothetical protein n=1 Tax=Bradyrhizobium sp. URHD0069 TaxID=1380355 RepID=UPI0012DFAA84|nr:hypothetical protein [Bradyrhizobium sp. URHD0069]
MLLLTRPRRRKYAATYQRGNFRQTEIFFARENLLSRLLTRMKALDNPPRARAWANGAASLCDRVKDFGSLEPDKSRWVGATASFEHIRDFRKLSFVSSFDFLNIEGQSETEGSTIPTPIAELTGYSCRKGAV